MSDRPGFWQSIRRGFGASDPRHWTQPGFLRLRLARDAHLRLAFAAGVGVLVGGLFTGLLVLAAPPDAIGMGVLLGLAMLAAAALIAFLWIDLAQIIVTLEDGQIHRKTKPLIFNPLGFLANRHDYWPYSKITKCAIAPAAALGTNYSALIIGTEGRLILLGIPPKVDHDAIAKFLARQGLRVQTVESIPGAVLPKASIARRGLRLSAVFCAIGIVLAGSGAGARAVFRGGGAAPKMDFAAVKKSAEAAPLGETVREFKVPGDPGIAKACISPDGKWVWGVGANSKKHFLWKDSQDEPIGELEIPAARTALASFTADNRHVIVAAEREIHVWQLEPLEETGKFELPGDPGALISSPDSRQLIVPSMIDLRVFELPDGANSQKFPLTAGAILSAVLAADRERVVVVYQNRIAAIRLRDGAVEDIVAFASPNAAYLFGSLSAGGSRAAMQAPGGTDLFDVGQKQKRTSIAAGAATYVPAVTRDGRRLAATWLDGTGVWDVETGRVVARFAVPQSVQLQLSANDERLLGYGFGVPKVFLWKMPAP
ncbi:MAG: WD40 repeat domain-containing protein [Planctomycetia bacterium]|nr:WD40 repeat domain-containing protein [Planctomycetia bacterium]